MKPMPSKHTDVDLKLMAEVHITYEIEQLVTIPLIQAQVAAFMHPIITQSLLEAFLVHHRSLADFVVAPQKPRHPTDVAAEDYYDGAWDGQPDAIFGVDVEAHQTFMYELHRRLAHISVQRVSTDDFVWSHAVRDRLPALVEALQRFISGLPPERRAWFAKAEALLSA
jgi:hypothetical protein